jgi:ubiquinone/menaquinone biosynthesis C-methylase UbiE
VSGINPAQSDLAGHTRSVPDVRAFWDTEACGSHFVQADKGTATFYEQYRRFRYRVEWHIPLLVPFSETRNKTVLEIGCGNGADGTLFAQAGARYTGVDLTDAAVNSARKHFSVLGLSGTFQIENAEHLSLPNDHFDFVYSYGVLHHTADPSSTFREVHRVLKPGGRAVLMLYHKHSFNYYVRILGYMRARLLWRILSRAGRVSRDRKHLTTSLRGVRGNQDSSVWQIHYENFLKTGWSYLRAENFVHHATDGPECPFAYVYTRAAIGQTFGDFSRVNTVIAHFPLRKYAIGRWIPVACERRLASWMGWYLFVYLTK